MYYLKKFNIRKYVFVLYPFLLGTVTYDGDFSFMVNKEFSFINKCRYRNIRFAIGNPQYDSLKTTNESYKINKRILFIESGHFPFGDEGRTELAKTILDICNTYKEYKLWIKPRFLKGDKNISHKNSGHLYDYIMKQCNNKPPRNLIMLNKYIELEQLVNKSSVILTLYSNTYIEASLKNKRCIVIGGLPNKDVLELRNTKTWSRIAETIKESGCMVNYKEVTKYLPEGLEFDENHKKNQIYDTNKVSEKIVEIVEYVYINFLVKGKFPKVNDYEYANYKEKIIEDKNLTWEKIEEQRIKNYFFMLRNLYDRKISFDLKWNKTETLINELYERGFMNSNFFEYCSKKIQKAINNDILENKKLFMKDKIDQSILFNTMLENGMQNDIINIDKKDIVCKELWFFIKGKDELKKNNYIDSIKFLKQYLNIVLKKDFEETTADRDVYKLSAMYAIGMAYVKIKDKKNAIKYFEMCCKTTNENHAQARQNIELLKL